MKITVAWNDAMQRKVVMLLVQVLTEEGSLTMTQHELYTMIVISADKLS